MCYYTTELRNDLPYTASALPFDGKSPAVTVMLSEVRIFASLLRNTLRNILQKSHLTLFAFRPAGIGIPVPASCSDRVSFTNTPAKRGPRLSMTGWSLLTLGLSSKSTAPKGGIQRMPMFARSCSWIPAFARMTGGPMARGAQPRREGADTNRLDRYLHSITGRATRNRNMGSVPYLRS